MSLQSDPEKQKLIQQQLLLVLHAHKCQRHENDNPNAVYSLRHCKTMKEVLGHMENCKMDRDCSFAHCSSSRQIKAHWKKCVKPDCLICSSLRQACKGNGND